jgi:16S rRNA G966 N2-methylase RsmD
MADFPYRNNIYTVTDKINIFKNLINNKLQFKKSLIKPAININVPKQVFLYKGKYYYLQFDSREYFSVMILSDMFNDICRAKCAFGNNISPLEYYENNKHKLITYLNKKHLKHTEFNMRDAIYNNVTECSTHHPGIIKKFIEIYDAKTVLDMSAGWGDRLLGALAAGVDLYVGVDPNPCLHPNYKNMIATLLPYSPNPNGKYIMVEEQFENYEIKKQNYFDLIYTSPPYFDYEKYTKISDKQSYISFPTENDWYEGFLQVAILKCIDALSYDGHLVLYLTQERGKSYMEKFLVWMHTHKHIYYMGCIQYSDQKFRGPHPIFIYKKSKSIPNKLYNPKPIIEKIIISNKKFNIVRDDYIIGGTKTRACIQILKSILKNKNIKNIIYSGAINGYAQVAIAYGLYLLKRDNIKLIFIFQNIKSKEISALKEMVLWYHTNTEYIVKDSSMKELYPLIDSYTSVHDYNIPFGFSFDEYEKLLYVQLKKHIDILKNIKKIWLVVGSGTILRTLQKLLPNTFFNGVQVGREIKDENIYDKSRFKLFKSSYKFYEEYKGNVGYHTMLSYDAKLLEFIETFGENDDYIWNVAGIHTYLL